MLKIHYLSGSRADFGLMQRTLQLLSSDSRLDVELVLTGQALLPRYGDVLIEAEHASLRVARCIPATLAGASGAEMALAMADELRGLTQFWSSERPDLVLLLGDRGEMLAGAIAAFHLEIATAHIHGGERSGSLDDAFRHAVSKLATWHFPATEDAAQRLRRMGESDSSIVVVGAPGLVEVAEVKPPPRQWIADRFGLPIAQTVALVLFHPVVQEAEQACGQMRELLAALMAADAAAIVLLPNSDAGAFGIERAITESAADPRFKIVHHLERPDYLAALAAADVIVGNSSSGIIESASLGTPCVNIGSRQEARQRNANVVDCPVAERGAIGAALSAALGMVPPFANIYGDGLADRRIRDAILALPIGDRAPFKRNAF